MLSGGCGPVIFDESVDGMEIVRDVDDVFTISFPLGEGPESQTSLPAPEIRGIAVRLLGIGWGDGRHCSLFKFKAINPGDAEILWWKVGGDGRKVLGHDVKVHVRRWDW